MSVGLWLSLALLGSLSAYAPSRGAGRALMRMKSEANELEKYSRQKQVDRKSLKRFLQIEFFRSPEKESLYPIFCAFETACRDVNRLMRRITTDNLDGYHTGAGGGGSVNIQGEDQKKLDVIANRIIKNALSCTGKVSVLASEEDDAPTLCSDLVGNLAVNGQYTAVFDPLDGSSNIDPGLPTGTILGLYKNHPVFGDSNPVASVTQRGSELVAAAYCLYSSSTVLALTIRNGLHLFTLDDVSGEFYLSRSNVRVPRSGSIYSFNDANDDEWPTGVKHFMSDLKAGTSPYMQSTRKRTSRYAGAFVADLHNIIINGGIFGYPGTVTKPNGKLRLVYEANPMALIIEEAGGSASSGRQRILDLGVSEVHQRVPLFIGSPEEVAAVDKYCRFYDPPNSELF